MVKSTSPPRAHNYGPGKCLAKADGVDLAGAALALYRFGGKHQGAEIIGAGDLASEGNAQLADEDAVAVMNAGHADAFASAGAKGGVESGADFGEGDALADIAGEKLRHFRRVQGQHEVE